MRAILLALGVLLVAAAPAAAAPRLVKIGDFDRPLYVTSPPGDTHLYVVEKGGTIVPVRKRLLAWQDPITGKWIFAKRVVQRPGGPRQGYRPWLGPAGEKFPEFMADHLRRA